MIFPVEPFLLPDGAQIMFRVRIKPLVRQLFKHLSFYFKGILGHVHEIWKFRHKAFLVSLILKSEPGHVYGDHADGAGERIGAEKSASAFSQFPVVQAQPAAHWARVLGFHVGIYKIGKIRYAVFGRHLPDRVKLGVVPVKIAGDIICGDREGENPPLWVALKHDFGECAVYHGHLFLELSVCFFLYLPAYHNGFIFHVSRHRQIHGDICEGRLEPDPCRNVHIENKPSHGAFYFLIGKLVVTDERGQQCVEICESLGARGLALERVEEIHYLPESRLKMCRRRGFYLALDSAEALHKKVAQIPAAAVNWKKAEIV